MDIEGQQNQHTPLGTATACISKWLLKYATNSNLITELLRAGEAWAVRLFKHENCCWCIKLFNFRRTGSCWLLQAIL